jgi:hypothetical protein
LQKPGSWFQFAEGCSRCDYRFEREVGYYVGSTWMVNYTATAVFGIVLAAVLARYSPWNGLGIAAATSAGLVFFGMWFFPFGNAIWMTCDHFFHPLTEKDRMSTQGTVRRSD